MRRRRAAPIPWALTRSASLADTASRSTPPAQPCGRRQDVDLVKRARLGDRQTNSADDPSRSAGEPVRPWWMAGFGTRSLPAAATRRRSKCGGASIDQFRVVVRARDRLFTCRGARRMGVRIGHDRVRLPNNGNLGERRRTGRAMSAQYPGSASASGGQSRGCRPRHVRRSTVRGLSGMPGPFCASTLATSVRPR